MAQKFLFVDANGDYTEANGYETSDFVSSSAGVGNAGDPIVLDAGGKLDASFLDLTDIDHGSISGLGDDDHTQYILVAGTRAFSGDQSMGSNKLTSLAPGTAGTDAVNKDQLDAAVSGLQDFRESVIDKDLATPPGSPTTGDRYIVAATATGAWAGQEKLIAEWDGSSWTFEAAPDEGTYCFVEDEDSAYIFNSNTFATGSWVVFNTGVLTAGDGIDIAGNSVSVDVTDLLGIGLTETSNNIDIDFSTAFNDLKAVAAQDLNSTSNGEGASIIGIEDASTYYTGTSVEAALNELEAQLGGDTSSTYNFTEDNVLADDDAVYAALNKLDLKWGDLASTANGEGASLVGIEDAGSYFTGTTVEAALQELAADVEDGQDYVSYTVGTGGVTKGDLVIITSNDTVTTYATITTGSRAPGLAQTTESASGTVNVMANDEVLTGVLTGATAGDVYFWDGSGHTTTIPSTSGAYVWKTGMAKNATDLHVEVEFIKKNI